MPTGWRARGRTSSSSNWRRSDTPEEEKRLRSFGAGKTAALLGLVLSTLGAGLPAAVAGTPRIMVMVDEKNLGAYTTAESEKVVTRYLLAQGLDIVDAEMVRTSIDRDKVLQGMTSGPRAAASLGLQFGAEVIIVGKAVAKGSAEQIQNSTLRSYQAQVSLRAVRTDTASVLGFESGSGAKVHVDDVVGGSEAIKAATGPLIAALLPKILAAWSGTAASPGRKIQLVIGNVSQIWQVSAIKDLLRKNIRHVEEVVQRNFVSGTAVFEVTSGSDSHTLAEALTMAKPAYFRLKVVGVSPGKLDMKLVDTDS